MTLDALSINRGQNEAWLQLWSSTHCSESPRDNAFDHQHFITWTEAQIDAGTMHNVRHLWTSVRANGPDRPHQLNRLELRICDLITDPEVLLAVSKKRVGQSGSTRRKLDFQSRLRPLQ